MNRLLRFLALFLLLAGAAGCGDGMVTVTGEVTFDGKPLPAGDVLLVPSDPHLPVHSDKVKNGRFQLKTVPGTKKVEFRASKFRPDIKSPMGPVYDEYIPHRYNTKSELTMEVTPKGENHFIFALEVKPDAKPKDGK